MNKLFKIERILLYIEIILASSSIFCAWLITLYSIIMRNLGYSTGDWTIELPVTLISWAIFVGSGYGIALNKHIKTDFFLKVIFPARFHKTLITIQYFAMLIFIAIIIYYGIISTQLYIETHYKLYELFYVPFSIIFVIVPLSMAVWIFHIILRIINIYLKKGDKTIDLWT